MSIVHTESRSRSRWRTHCPNQTAPCKSKHMSSYRADEEPDYLKNTTITAVRDTRRLNPSVETVLSWFSLEGVGLEVSR
jgi:hypothetical protein